METSIPAPATLAAARSTNDADEFVGGTALPRDPQVKRWPSGGLKLPSRQLRVPTRNGSLSELKEFHCRAEALRFSACLRHRFTSSFINHNP